MIAKERVWSSVAYACLVALLLAVLAYAAKFGLATYQVARSRAFCKAVAGLSQGELSEFASRCERLLTERGGPSAPLEFATDASIRGSFKLAGQTPSQIVVQSNTVWIDYLHPRRHCASVAWKDDYSESGDRIKVLRTYWGDGSWQDVYTRAPQAGEPDGTGDEDQPSGSETNRSSEAAGLRR